MDELFLHCLPAFGGAYLRRIYQILDTAIGMGCPLTLAVSGPVTVSGQQHTWLIPLLETGWVAYLSTTDAVCYHDGHRSLDAYKSGPIHEVSINSDDAALRDEGTIRVTDMAFDEGVLLDQDRFLTAVLARAEFQRKMTGTELRYLLGKYYAAQEAWAGERREREHGNRARQKPGASPRGPGSRRQPLPQARLEIGRRLEGCPGANEPVECGIVASRGTAGRAFLEMGDDRRMSALRGRRRIHDPFAELVAGHGAAAGGLPGLGAHRSAASGPASAGGELGASRSGRRKPRRFSSARTRRRRTSVSETPSASAAAATESRATRMSRNTLRSPAGNAATAERTRAVRADTDSASLGAGISRTSPGFASWMTFATRLHRNAGKGDSGA